MINIAIILGNVGSKESKSLKNGGEMTMLSVATSKSHKDPFGATKEITTWHNVICFNKMSEIAKKYIHVGDKIHVQGEIQHKKLESGERAGQYSYSILAHDLKFIPTTKKVHDTSTQAITITTQNEDAIDDAIPF